jgi:hypothetical protein
VSQGSVNVTSAGEAEGDRSKGSGYGHRVPHRKGQGSEKSMMYGPETMSSHSKQILQASVDIQKTLSVGG